MDVFELQWVSDPQISPSGDQIAYLRNRMDVMKDRRVRSIWLMNADGSGHRKLTSFDGNESSPRWSPDGSRLAFTTSDDDGNGSEIYVFWTKSGQLARLSQLDRSPGGLSWSPNGQWIAFSKLVPEARPTLAKAPKKPKGAVWADPPRVETRVRHERDGSGFIEPGYRHYFIMPADGGAPRQVTSGNYQHGGTPVWSADGESLIFSANRNDDWEYDYRNSEIYSVNIMNGKVQALTERQGPDASPAISPDGKTIAYLSYEDKVQTYQLSELRTMGIDGSKKRTIALELDRQVSAIRWDKDGRGLYFMYDSEGNTKIGHVTTGGKFTLVAENVGGVSVARPYGGGSYSVSDDDVIAHNVTTPNYPADLALSKVSTSTRRLTQLNASLLDHRELGATEEIWYESSFDGRRIQGWITKPPFYDASRKYPLVVENHGGPISNYGDRFSPEVQLYASAGYVVFYPNPRGSTSYGEEFGNLLYHNYPGQDYDDVMSGVDALVEQGIVSEDSLFVTGGSAGGIMTAWIVGNTDRFRAAAVIKPVMNWYSKTLVADNWYGYYNYRYPGLPWENPDIYMKFSPISVVGNVTTPTLVMVGTSDLRTPLSEAKQMYHALKWRKVETALVEMPGA
ncbi:MAG: S9 family peptidase, partial [Bacteroidota bacterium]